MSDSVRISATIITFNEEKKIEACIRSLLSVADEIVVVDSCSTDSTEAICKKYPVRFISHPFEGYVAQKNFAMRQAVNDYVLSLDADEALSEELKSSILKVKHSWNAQWHGFSVNRRNYYCGQWIRFCGWYPDRKIRLWDRRKAKWEGTDPHDKVMIPKEYTLKLQGDLLHDAYFSIDEHLKQMYKFAEVSARAKFNKGVKAFFIIHVILNPVFKFVKKYFFQLGFLDGYYGFVFCVTTSLLNFYKYLRLYEYNRKGLPD